MELDDRVFPARSTRYRYRDRDRDRTEVFPDSIAIASSDRDSERSGCLLLFGSQSARFDKVPRRFSRQTCQAQVVVTPPPSVELCICDSRTPAGIGALVLVGALRSSRFESDTLHQPSLCSFGWQATPPWRSEIPNPKHQIPTSLFPQRTSAVLRPLRWNSLLRSPALSRGLRIRSRQATSCILLA